VTHAPLRLTSAFHPDCIALIREMEADGWTGKITKKNHARMLAPDGVTTCMISPNPGAPHRAANLSAEYRRWKREQAEAAAAEAVQAEVRKLTWLPWPGVPPLLPALTLPEPEPEPEPVKVTVDCTECGKPFATLQAMSVHRVRAHVRVNCPICARPFSPGNLPRHLVGHDEATLPEEVARRELYRARAELTRLREEIATWQDLAEETEENYLNALGGTVRRPQR
jgi:endogenous inhibitor of DNA gyrase (YacG/DUF329 family)